MVSLLILMTVGRKLLRQARGGLVLGGLTAALTLSGCDKPEEKVLDIEGPGVDIEVNRSADGSRIEIENNSDQP